MSGSLQQALQDRLTEDPGASCLAFVKANGEVAWESRQEVMGRAAAAAERLADRGLGAGDTAIVVSVDPRECATTTLAILARGARPLLVAPPAIQGVNSSLNRILVDVARRARAKVALLPAGMDEVASQLREAGMNMPHSPSELSALDSEGVTFSVQRATDTVALQLTSGTTGFPRIAAWRQRALLDTLESMRTAMDIHEGDVFANWTPLYHDMGLVNNFLFCLVHGLPLALLSPLDVVRRPALWMRALDRAGATTTWSPNFGYALVAERVSPEELEGVSLSKVRGFWNAAERVHLETLERFHARVAPCGVERRALRTNFGCVETIGGVTFTAPGEAVPTERLDLAALRSGTARRVDQAEDAPSQWFVGCGRAASPTELGILDDDGNELADGRIGRVAVRGGSTFDGYVEDEAATGSARCGPWTVTGDLGYLRDGELFWTGRNRERIKIQGRSFDPSELEHVLDGISGLRKGCFAAFGREDTDEGTERLVVLAEVLPEVDDLSAVAQDVRSAVAMQAGVTLGELGLVAKGTLTKTSSGKRRHLHFRELYERGEVELLHRSGSGRLG